MTDPDHEPILAIDVGGSGIKAAPVDLDGNLQQDKVRVETPTGAHPDEIVQAIVELVEPLPRCRRVAVGFPGMVRRGRVLTAPNLGHDAWRGYPLAERLAAELDAEVRLANDADVQGLAVIEGKGLEMVCTLGTGFGTGLYEDGRLCPHLELAHVRFRKGETYDEQLGDAARETIGKRRWRKRVRKAIANMRALVHFDRLYLGGGNADHLDPDDLPDDVTIVDNKAGIAGGAALWRPGVGAT
ncbi:MAG: ROK family protein [Planctomycetota bacterium]